MRKYAPFLASVVVVSLFISNSVPTRGQSAGNANPRVVMELSGVSDSPGGGLTLDVTFFGTQPSSDEAEEALRHCLEAARVMHPINDIEARAWFRASIDASARQAIAFGAGAESLVFKAKDKAIHPNGASDVSSTGAGDDPAGILKDSTVLEACQAISQEHVSQLVDVGLAQRGKEHKRILSVMRDWGKENNIVSSRQLRRCMSSISKAVVALKAESTSLSPEDLSAAIARGKAIFTGSSHCVNCHGDGGRGGRSGPRLSDSQWLHCDGSIEGIRRVIQSGVPLDQLKDKNRPFPMQPAMTNAKDEQNLADLAAYVHSLSQQ